MADIPPENVPPTDETGDGDLSARIIPINIEEEMKSSYIDYSMSVIVSRALPDVRDGLKPVQRRVLYGMQELGLAAGRVHKKSARIVGEVLGKYHPHGDQSVYDALVRMAQDFAMRGPLVDGQGNFGSVDGDSAAAMRYTEARMTRLAEELLRDLDKETVDYVDNFDGSLQEPTVLPAAFPNLLVNGASGIAVGMATNIPPHNLGEIVDAVIATIDSIEDGEAQIELDELMEHVPAPDFPTGGLIYGIAGVREAYRSGRGRVIMRATMHEEEIRKDRDALIVTEIPYQVNKATLIEKIAHAVRDKKVEGVADLRDESDRDGMRIVIELKRDAVPEVTKNQLFKYSQLQQTFGVNIVALVNGRPRTLGIKALIEHYIAHRHEVVVRRTEFDLRHAEGRAHVLEGLTIALDHIDAVIAIIRHSADTDEAKANLMAGVYPERLTEADLSRLGLPTDPPIALGTKADTIADLGLDADDPERGDWLSARQADAILALRLSRLTGLEREKILAEYREILQEIERLRSILGNEALRFQIIKEELLEIREKYADDRRTRVDPIGGGDIDLEDLIENERMVVTVTNQGLAKRTAIGEYRSQARGGRGLKGLGTRTEDWVEHLFAADTHDYLLFFTDHGQVYWLRVYDVPEGGRVAKGRSVRNLIQIAPDDRVRAVIGIKKENFRDPDFLQNHFVLMATRNGLVKKTALDAFKRPLRTGIIAIDIVDGDQLIEAHLTDGDTEVLLGGSGGRAIRFHERDVRAMGRKSRGVRGMKLREGERVVGMIAVRRDEAQVLTISANGYGKRTTVEKVGADGEPISNYTFRLQSRGGQGVTAHQITDRTGALVALKSVVEDDELMIGTEHGLLIRMPVAGISSIGRSTQGVRVINLRDGDRIADVARLVTDGADPEAETADGADEAPPTAQAA
ncbi:MAG: DNA gyrase subunit A [Bacteroidota bacterium]